jgi:hypothetical protein
METINHCLIRSNLCQNQAHLQYMTCPDVDTRVLNQNPIASPICDMLNQHERIPAKVVCKMYEQQK